LKQGIRKHFRGRAGAVKLLDERLGKACVGIWRWKRRAYASCRERCLQLDGADYAAGFAARQKGGSGHATVELTGRKKKQKHPGFGLDDG
jgi:hypothetical protein